MNTQFGAENHNKEVNIPENVFIKIVSIQQIETQSSLYVPPQEFAAVLLQITINTLHIRLVTISYNSEAFTPTNCTNKDMKENLLNEDLLTACIICAATS
jgi:hypothetical protein